MSDVIQLRKRGVFTLPKSLRDKYELGEGDALQLVDVDGVFVLTPMAPMVPKLAREIQRLRERDGVSTDELLQHLRDTRTRLTQEQYGEEPADA
jgi:bifunctional DNA-binding transcriptional regulator/antitoxin component of YhaV-PrlF toxin-antitoxin module